MTTVEDRRIVHERRHWPAPAFEEGHRPPFVIGGERDRFSRAVQIGPRRLRPVHDAQGGVAEDALQLLLELPGGAYPTQLDH